MRGVWLGGLVLLLSSGVQAQSTPLEPVSLAPPAAEPGWTVRTFNGGYARWETEPDDGTQGGVQVVPAPAVERATPPPEGEARVAPGRQPPVVPRQPVCDALKRKLAVRLLELRGIDATDDSAPYVLAALETPLSPHAWAGVRGLGPGAGSTLLATAYSSDLIARGLVDEITRCLAQSGTSPRPGVR